MSWLEYNIHVTNPLNFAKIVSVILDFVDPFITSKRENFEHWHYLFEPNICRSSVGEIRLRFKGTPNNLTLIKNDLIVQISAYKIQTNHVMADTDPMGSHEGAHGVRNQIYQGEAATFGVDWNAIVEILQIGSESAIKIFRLGNGLTTIRSRGNFQSNVAHPYFLHLPANQLLAET